MSSVAFLLLAVLLSAAGSIVLVLRQRKPTRMGSSVDEFRREMRALAPPGGDEPRSPRHQ